MQKTILTEVGEMSQKLIGSIAGAFNVDPEKIAGAFSFNMDEDELQRLMTTFVSSDKELSADANLRALGYADKDKPYTISIYLRDFAAKEHFIDFLDEYNQNMEDLIYFGGKRMSDNAKKLAEKEGDDLIFEL